ncbi:MAG TPA: TIGR02147 family protein, partial [Bdellovibrionota bacterium]|nr:TIGR02147 family protein [Bdellovibrionota bacterium]
MIKGQDAGESVYQHAGFRNFLLAHAARKKARARGWSYRRWARDLGLENAASLTRILKGDRAPGPEMTEKLVAYFGFAKAEAEFFRHLVRLDKTREGEVRVLLMERLRKLHPRRKFRELDHKAFLAISSWYFAPIRESMRMRHALQDPAAIARALGGKVTPTEVKRAIEILVELGLLCRDAETGKLSYVEGVVDSRHDIESEGVDRYLEQFLDQAKEAVRTTSIDEGSFSGTAVAVRLDRLAEAKAMIRDFKARFIELAAAPEGEGDAVYQFQVQFFPV